MIIEQEKQQVDVTGFEQGMTFSADTSDPMLFSMLFDRLYTYKARSMFREVLSNAYDAHQMIDRPDLPIDVELPTYLSPQLIVRDHGPGMTPDVIRSVFAVCFKSTKRASNKFIGGYGIGAKSPFAYTSMFTIESSAEGVKTTYIAYRDESNIPRLTQSAEQPCAESGVSIIIPVESEDIEHVETEVLAICSYFADTTIRLHRDGVFLKNATKVVYENNSLHTDGPYKWARRIGTSEGANLVTANVAFKIDFSQNDLAQLIVAGVPISTINDMKLDLFVENGTVDLSGSRETLAYTDKTISVLADAAHKILQLEVEKTAQTLDQYDSMWAAFLAAGQHIDGLSHQLQHTLFGAGALKYKGEKIPASFPLKNYVDQTKSGTSHVIVRTRPRRFSNKYVYAPASWRESTMTSVEGQNAVFVVIDEHVSKETLLRKIRSHANAMGTLATYHIFGTAAEIAETFGNPPTKTLDVYKVPRNLRHGDRYDGPRRIRVKRWIAGRLLDETPVVADQVEGTVFYITPSEAADVYQRRLSVRSPVTGKEMTVPFVLINQLVDQAADDVHVYEIKDRHLKVIADLDNWKPFSEYESYVANLFSNSVLTEQEATYLALKQWFPSTTVYAFARSVRSYKPQLDALVTNPSAKQIFDRFSDLGAGCSKTIKPSTLLNVALEDAKPYLYKLINSRSQELKDFIGAHPLLEWVPIEEKTLAHVADYINRNV